MSITVSVPPVAPMPSAPRGQEIYALWNGIPYVTRFNRALSRWERSEDGIWTGPTAPYDKPTDWYVV